MQQGMLLCGRMAATFERKEFMRRIQQFRLVALLGPALVATWSSGAVEKGETIPFRVGWATRAARPPVIDGRLSDSEPWRRSPALDRFVLLDGRPQEVATEAYLLHDDSALYIGVRCREKPRRKLRAQVSSRDGRVHSDDSVEIFLAPPTSTVLATCAPGQRYFHLAVNARGVRFDTVGRARSWVWSGPWEARTTARADGWDAEMRIPFKTLGTDRPRAGVWKFNLCRNRSGPNGPEYGAWSPVDRTFHEHRLDQQPIQRPPGTEHFGRIVLAERAGTRAAMHAEVLRGDLRLRLAAATDVLAGARSLVVPLAPSTPGRRACLAELDKLRTGARVPAKEVNAVGSAALEEGFAGLCARIAALDAQGRAARRKARRVRTGARMVKLSGRMPKGSPFVVLTGPVITNERFLPGRPWPKSFRASTALSAFACPGEIEPVTFVLGAPVARKNVRLTIGKLTGTPGTLGAGVVDPFVLKYWYQSGRAVSRHMEKPTGPLLVPELLLKDDSLIVVDHKTRSNYMRTAKGLVNISERRLEFSRGRKGKQLVKNPKLLHLAPKDAKELQPFDVPAGGFKQIWLTLRLPDDAAPGTYQGTIRVAAAGAGHVDLTLHLEVLPIRLEPSVVEYSIYYRGRLRKKPFDFSRELYWGTPLKTEKQLLVEMRNMLAHGVDNPNIYQRENFQRVFALREQAGLPKRDIYALGVTVRARDKKGRKEMVANLRPWIKYARAGGYGTLYGYGYDEPSDAQLQATRAAVRVAHGVGVRTFTAIGRSHFQRGLELLDLLVVAGRPERRFADAAHQRGRRIFSYAFPQVGREEPLTYRQNYGVRLWKSGYDGTMNYAYQHYFGHVWNDFDGPGHRDHVFAYPTVDGVIDTAQWEGFREGVDDVRYISTLLAAIRKAKADPVKQAAAVAAERWLAGIDHRQNLDALRRQMAEKTIQLMR